MTPMFTKSFRDSRRTLIWTAVGLVVYTLFVMSFYPVLVEQEEEIDKMLDAMPDSLLGMVMGSEMDRADFSIAEPGVFLHGRVTSWTVLLLGALVIAQAFNAFTNGERDGSMDMLLSLPISRRRMLLGRTLNTALMVLAVLAALFVALAAATVIWSEFDIALGDLALAIFMAFLPLMVVAGFSYMLATLIPSSRKFAGPLAYLFLIGSYLVHGFAVGIPDLKGIRPFLLYEYYNASDVVRRGADLGDVAVLVIAAAVFFGVAWWAVDRKEIGV